MTKEKLIALSDLNREDNIKYISSEAQGIAITLDSDRFAPNICNLIRAYICGRRKSEKRIVEQEELLNSTLEENKEIYKKMADLDTALEDCTESLTDARIKIKELEKENAELKAINEGYCRSRDRLASIGLPTFMSCKETVNKLKEAKDLIRNLLRVTYGEGWNYSLDVKVKAEDFLGGEK